MTAGPPESWPIRRPMRSAARVSHRRRLRGTRCMVSGDSIGATVLRGWHGLLSRRIVLAASALAALVLTGSASAAEITYTAVGGIWHDPVDNLPGSQPGDPVITNGTPTSIIRWGDTSGSQSGYDFTGTLPPPFTLPGPIPFFSLGSFTHRNFEVDDPSLTSVQLDVVLAINVDGVPRAPLTFTFTFNHQETPNNQTPCPYPTPVGEGCTDRVTIVASPTPTTFNVDGVDYTLSMSFLNNGNPVSEFITQRRRHDQQLGPRRRIYAAADPARHAGAQRRQIGPGDDESGGVGQFRHRRAERGDRRRVQRDTARSSAQRPDGRHVRRHAASLERARVRGGRRDPGAGQRPSGPGDGLFARLQRRRVRAHVQHVDARVGDRCRRTPRDRVPRAARLGFSVRQRADERGRRDAVVQRRRHESGPHRLHAHRDRRHRRHRGPRGRAHRRGRAAAVRRQVGGAASRRDVARHRRRGRRAALHDPHLQQRQLAVHRGRAARCRTGEHDVRPGHADVERPTRRPARRWRVAAGRGRRRELAGSSVAATCRWAG